MGDLSSKKHSLIWVVGFVALLVFTLVIRVFFIRANPADIRTENSTTLPAIIYTDSEGLYTIDLKKVFKAEWEKIDITTLALSNKGLPVAMWQIGEGVIAFWGDKPDQPYTNHNIYSLTTNLDQKTIVTTPTIRTLNDNITGSPNYLSVFHLEENRVYTPYLLPEDAWFGSMVGSGGDVSLEFTSETSGIGESTVSVKFWSNTQSSVVPDHSVEVYINGEYICSDTWDGVGYHTTHCTIPADQILSGANSFMIKLPGVDRVPAEVSYLDWADITIRKSLVASRQYSLIIPENEFITLPPSEQSKNWLFDLDATNPSESWLEINDASIVPVTPGHRYVFCSMDCEMSSAQVKAVQAATTRENQQADMLVIGEYELLQAAKELLIYRESQGLITLPISVEEIYDQYSYGYPDPDAIRSYIIATQEWDRAPKYILLLGDASYDIYAYQTSIEHNRLPTYFVNTEFGGYTASDAPFADIDADGYPDLSLGRIPASTTEEVKTLVKKIINYEKSSSGEWKDKFLIVADGQEPAFSLEAEKITQILGQKYETDLFTPSAGSKEAPSVIREKITEGQGFVMYIGHGSIQIWGKDKLFTSDDVEALKTGSKTPIFINLTCLTGLFTHPKNQSISEALLWKQDGGGVGVIAPTSLTLSADQSYFSDTLAKNLLSDQNNRLGDVILHTWQDLRVGGGAGQDVVNTFLYFGDPALIVR